MRNNILHIYYKVKRKIKTIFPRKADRLWPPIVDPDDHRFRDMLEAQMSKTIDGRPVPPTELLRIIPDDDVSC